MSKSIKNSSPAKSVKSSNNSSWLSLNQPVQKRKIYLLILALAFLFYGNTMWNGYSMDDELVTENHPIVSKGISGIPKIFTTRYAVNESQSYEYRPVVLVSYAIEYQFFGFNAGISHFVNILLYAITGMVLFNLLFLFFKNEHWILPLLVVIFFLIHPIHTEVVASLKNRDEILAFLFALLSLRFFYKYTEQNKISTLIYGVLFLVISLLSKKSSMTMIALIPLSLYYFSSLNLKKLFLFAVLGVVAFIIYRLSIIGMLNIEDGGRRVLYFENPMFVKSFSFFEKIAFGFHTTGFYLLKMIAPYPLVVYYGYNAVELGSWSDPATLIAIPVILFLFFNSIRKIGQKNIYDFGILWFFVAISMYTNVLAPAVGIVAERFAYLPSLGFVIAVSYLFYSYLLKEKTTGKLIFPRSAKAVIAIVLICSSAYTINRNFDWNSRYSIYITDVEKVPESAKIHALLGAHYTNELEQIRKGKVKADLATVKSKADSSKLHFAKAIHVYDGYTTMYNNLGTIYFSYLDQPDSALQCFEKAVALDSSYAQALLNLSISYERKADRYETMFLFFDFYNGKDSLFEIGKIKNLDKIDLLFDETKLFEIHLKNYISGLVYSGSQERLSKYPSEIPGIIDQGIAQYYAKTEIKPNRDTLIKKLTIGLGRYLNKEIYGDPLTLKGQVIFETFGQIVYDWCLKTAELSDVMILKNYAKQQYDFYTEKIIVNLNQAIENSNSGNFSKMMIAFDKLNKIYQKTGNGDSIVSLNSRYLSNPYFQKELLMIEIGNGYLLKSKIPEAIEWYKKSIDENLRILNGLQIIHNQLAAAGGTSHLLIKDWYKMKIKLIGETYFKIASKLNEIGKGEEAQLYFAEAQKFQL